MPSVVIAAHNEESVIGACLEALLAQDVRAQDVVVVANGCTDRTADVARSYGVVVIDRPEPGKAAALNVGDDLAAGFPRIYLDADIVTPPGTVSALHAALGAGALAAVPRRRIATASRPWPVRAYFSVNERLPVFQKSLFGRGTIALSEAGRARFIRFPELVADDLFLDTQFAQAEKREVASVTVVVEAPYTTRDLVRRLVRVRQGNRQLRAAISAGEVSGTAENSDKWAWLRDVVAPRPGLWLNGAAYAVITLAAGFAARRARAADGWGRDESTRRHGHPQEGSHP